MNLRNTQSPRSDYIPGLSPLRGFAALMVAVYHFEEIAGQFVNPDSSMFIRKAYLMVDLFFIMSGFIIMHVYGQNFAGKFSRHNFFKFIRARFARIYPLHFFMLMFIVWVYFAAHEQPSPIKNLAAIPTHLLLLHSFGIHSIYTWNVPSWSISAEWWSYMVFPLLALFLYRNKKSFVIIMGCLSLLIYISIMFLLPRVDPLSPANPVPHNLDVSYDFGFLRGLSGFIIGMIVYHFYENKKLFDFFGKDLVGITCVFLTVLSLHAGANDLVCVLFFALLVFSFAANRDRINTLCTIKPLQFLGDVSYSVYMIHIVIVFVVAIPVIQGMHLPYNGPKATTMEFSTGLTICLIYLVFVIGFSALMYYSVEKKCRKWINKLFP